MNIDRRPARMTIGALLRTGTTLLLLVLACAAGAAQPSPGPAKTRPADALSDADKTCLSCHGAAGLTKTLANQEKLPLHVAPAPFARSVHAAMGCTACHADIDLGQHPQRSRQIKSSREYSVAMTRVCSQCHEDKQKLYEGSIHATLLKQGNPVAPVCTDCHGAHDVMKGAAAQNLEGVSCRRCHENVYTIYIDSVHGQSRAKSGPGKAPICADCHQAHDVAPASTGSATGAACVSCHGDREKTHQAIFPNAKRHLEAVSCAACHAPSAQRKIDLRLFDAAARKRMAVDDKAATEFEERIRAADAQGHGLDPRDVWSILQDMNKSGTKTALRGRLEVKNGIEAHMLVTASHALRTCETCHRQGAAPFQTVTLSIVGPGGRPVRYETQKEVLSDPLSVDALRGFYAIGGTRIGILDALLALALLAGVSVPVLHLTLRWFLRRRRDRQRNS